MSECAIVEQMTVSSQALNAVGGFNKEQMCANIAFHEKEHGIVTTHWAMQCLCMCVYLYTVVQTHVFQCRKVCVCVCTMWKGAVVYGVCPQNCSKYTLSMWS